MKKIFLIGIVIFFVLLHTGVLASPLIGDQMMQISKESIMLQGEIDGKPVELAAMVYRPTEGTVPRPVIILTHGRKGAYPPNNPKEIETSTTSCTRLAQKGFVVAFVARSGYGTSVGPDFEGTAVASSAYKLGMEGAKSIELAVKAIRQLPYVDPNKVIVGGLSVGGLSTMAAASRKLEGVIGYVNFAGFPVNLNNQADINNAFAQFGKTAKTPSLWLYSSGDQYLKYVDVTQLKDSFLKAGGQCKLQMTRYVENGHNVMGRSEDWMNYLDEYFDSIGLQAN